MIDEKRLIEDLQSSDWLNFNMQFTAGSPEDIARSLQEFSDKMKECFVDLICAQPPVFNGFVVNTNSNRGKGWIRTRDEQPGMYVSVLMYIPGDDPLPTVHEGYLTGDNIWISLYKEAYTMDEVPYWMPMPEPPKDGES